MHLVTFFLCMQSDQCYLKEIENFNCNQTIRDNTRVIRDGCFSCWFVRRKGIDDDVVLAAEHLL